MAKNTFKISIITPSLNKGRYIKQAIQSVIDQDYTNIEHIIVDGGSTDNTLKILSKYKGYDHIKLSVGKDNGFIDGLNKAARMITGDIVSVLNADDYFEPNIFKKVVNEFAKDPKNIVLVGNLNRVNAKGRLIQLIKPVTSLNKILQPWWYNFPLNPCSYFYKNVHKHIGYFSDKYGLNTDYEYIIRLAKKYKLTYIDYTFGNFRYYPDSKTYANRKNGLIDAVNVSKNFHGSIFNIWFYYYKISYFVYNLKVKASLIWKRMWIFLRTTFHIRTSLRELKKNMFGKI